VGILQTAFERSAQLSDWLQQVLHEQGTLDKGSRNAVSLAFVSLALDHREAFLLLVHEGARATAMAVTRPVLEGYIRALWAYELATDEELAQFMKGRLDPSLERTFQRLRKSSAPSLEVFEILRKHYRTLSDYAHGGGRQVSRWLHATDIEPRYSDEQMAEALHFVDVIGVLASMARERLLGHGCDLIEAKLNETLAPGPAYGHAQEREKR
jgi:hypothetical protein